MIKFNGTIEYLDNKRAIVALFDPSGAWSGAYSVEVKYGGKSALYEAGYARADQEACLKEGRLETFKEVPHAAADVRMAVL